VLLELKLLRFLYIFFSPFFIGTDRNCYPVWSAIDFHHRQVR